MRNLLIIAVLTMMVFSCSKGKENKPISKTPEATSKIETINLAKVNNSKITAEDLRQEFNMLNPQAQQLFMTEGGFENLLDELIKKEILYQESLKRDYTTRDEYKKIMEDYKKRVMIGLLLKDEVEEKSKVSDEEVREFYDENRKDFMLEKPEKGEPDVVDFESVKRLIQEHLEAKKQAEIFDSYVSKLQESYKVEIDKDAFNTTFGSITASPTEGSIPKEAGGQKSE